MTDGAATAAPDTKAIKVALRYSFCIETLARGSISCATLVSDNPIS